MESALLCKQVVHLGVSTGVIGSLSHPKPRKSGQARLVAEDVNYHGRLCSALLLLSLEFGTFCVFGSLICA
jgi:hypothetical protein